MSFHYKISHVQFQDCFIQFYIPHIVCERLNIRGWVYTPTNGMCLCFWNYKNKINSCWCRPKNIFLALSFIRDQTWANNLTPLCYLSKTRCFGNFLCKNLWKSRLSYSTQARVEYLYLRWIWGMQVESSRTEVFLFSTIYGL